MSIRVTAVIRPVETRTLGAVGDDYEAGRRAVDELVPDGWQIIQYTNAGKAE